MKSAEKLKLPKLLNKMVNKSLKTIYAEREFLRRGGFSSEIIGKRNGKTVELSPIKIDIDKKIRTSKKSMPGDLENRYEKRNGISNRDERDVFFENRADVCTSIKRPKSKTGEKMRKKENADRINQDNAVHFERADLTKMWELYIEKNKPIDFRSFENKMKRTVFSSKVFDLLKAH